MLHVSDLIREKKCDCFCWQSTNNPIHTASFYKMDYPFSDLWKTYLQATDCALGHSMDSNEVSLRLLEQNEVVCFARFEYKECRTKIPYLKKIGNGYLAIYPFLNAYPKENEALIMKINQMILEHNGVHIIENRVLYLNKEYVRKETLDLKELFLCSDKLYNRRNHLSKTIQEYMDEINLDLDTWIEKTKKIMEAHSMRPKRTKQCTALRRCIYYPSCFDEQEEPDDSILFLTTSQHKIDAYEKGIRHIHQIPMTQLEGFRLQYAQYMASKTNHAFMDKAAFQVWLKNIEYPISYLDFEWDTFAVPPYSNMKPFDVLCFQYSLHVETQDGKLTHYNFFESKDCRKHFIEKLIHDLPKSGTILVYNMEGAEKLRLMQLADQFEEYRETLERICARMIDLSKPFEAGLFYDSKMRGHYSLKSILPVFSKDVSYHDLDIQNGMNAVYAYRTYDEKNEQEKKEVKEAISTYCQMDTYAEYIVYHGILKKIEEEDLDA